MKDQTAPPLMVAKRWGWGMLAAMTSIPVLATADLCVVGGSAAGAAAAIAAAQAGARTVLLAERTYLGDDLAGAFELTPGAAVADPLAAALWPTAQAATPLHLKATLEQAAIAAGVELVYATGPIHVRDGVVVVATSGGLLAVLTKVVIDATRHRLAARLAGLAPALGGRRRLALTVLGDRPEGGEALGEIASASRWSGKRTTAAWRVQATVDLGAGAPADWAAAESALRDRAFTPGQLRAADLLIDLDAVAGDTWLADGCAVAPLAGLAPAARLAAGTALGQEAARRARTLPAPRSPAAGAASALRWLPTAARYATLPSIALPQFDLPRLGNWQVVVLGGGTGGAPAGISAARHGASTLVCEAAPGLGGVGTQGMIGCYWHGNRVGFTAEIDRGTAGMGEGGPAADSGKWNVEWKAAWYLRQLLAAKAAVWFGVRGAGCSRTGDQVDAVVVTTPWGPGVLSCAAAVDATGAATIPAAAGAPCTSLGAQQVAVQGSGLSPRELGVAYRNSDWTFIDDADPADVTRAYAAARRKFAGEFDVAQVLDTRERRQIVAELDLDPLDFLADRTFPDTVVTASSNFDSHGFTIHPVFMVEPPDKSSLWAHVPLRSLLPRGLEGVLVTGLGMGCHRDALPVVRMQPDVQNAGYAAGVCAAWAAQRHGGRIRALDIREVQRELVRVGSLDAAVLGHADSFPLSDAAIAAAVAGELKDHRSLAIVFHDPARSLPLLRRRTDLRAALVMGLMGEAAGAPALIAAVDAQDWDEGWNYTGMGQFGRSLSPMDVLVIALGRTGDPAAVAAVRRKIERLTCENAFSHVRAASIAASCLGAHDLAPALAHFLTLPGVAGQQRSSLAEAAVPTDDSLTTTSDRNRALRELIAARGLWHCGDHAGMAERTLRAYAGDQRGHFARHAQAILTTPAAAAERAWRLAMA